MSFTIALAGKGGTGKTTIAGLAVRYIVAEKHSPVLAVDADSNNCLHDALGVDVHTTIGNLREDSLDIIRSGADRPGGMSMEQMFDYQVQQSLVESSGFDLLVMGRPEGPGCYCAANNIIRKYTDRLSESYPYMVIDNEAGMEHLSRRTSCQIDLLLVVSDSSSRGIRTAKRIHLLVDELGLEVNRRALLINRVLDSQRDALAHIAEDSGMQIAGMIPQDSLVAEFDMRGNPVLKLPEESPALKAVFSIFAHLQIP